MKQSKFSPEGLPRYLDKNFPELRAFFPWLSGGYEAGAQLQSLFVAYPDRIGRACTQRLLAEVHRLQRIGDANPEDLRVLLRDFFALHEEVLTAEHHTAGSLLSAFEQVLAGLRTSLV